jgi:hypothetical protein
MALAQALMQRGGLGDILALTGDRVIAPVGAAMGARVQKQREGLQKARGDALDRESSERLRQATIDAAKEGRLAREEFALAGRKETQARYNSTKQFQLSKEVRDTGLTRVVPTLLELEYEMKSYMDKGENAPGVGGYYDRWTAGLSDEGRKMKRLMAGVVNPELLARSGAAVTTAEEERLLTELGEGTLSNDADVWAAIQLLKRVYSEILTNAYAGVTPEVEADFIGRGGLARNVFELGYTPLKTEDPESTDAAVDPLAEKRKRAAALRAELGG